ncbi:MAG: glycosyltransferase [Phycisphaeraceae bacterium]
MGRDQATERPRDQGERAPRSLDPSVAGSLRIFHIITRLILGGAQKDTIMLAAAQAAAGHAVHLAYGPIYGPEGSLYEEAAASGATLHEVRSLRRAVLPVHDALCYRALRRLIREVQPDVVHTHSSKAGILGRAAGWAERAPAVIHTVHGLPFHDRQPRWLNRAYVNAERWAARRCHHLIAITPAMVEAFEQERIADRARFTVIPSGVDTSELHVTPGDREAVRAELGIPPDAPVLGIIARLDPLKGHDDLLDIVPELLKWQPDLRLLFIGDGWHRPHLEQRIEAEGLRDRVILTGLVPHAQIAHFLAAVDVNALPSYQEGQGLTLAEALLSGCAIVGYDVGGIGTICIDGETGRLVRVGDRRALAEAIRWLFEHPDQRRQLVRRGQQLVRRDLDPERLARRTEQVYRRVLNQ